MYEIFTRIRSSAVGYIASLKSSIQNSTMDVYIDDTFECGVCFQKQCTELSVTCTEFYVPDAELEELSTDSESDSDESSSSEESIVNVGYQAIKAPVESRKNQLFHRFCADCVRGLAKTACDDAPLAKGAVGLRCMDTDCDHVLLLSDFRKFLPSEILDRLEERMQHEALISARIKNLERCMKCNYGQIMKKKPSKKTNRKFVCQACSATHCRLCKSPWKTLHAGRTCWQFKWIMHYRYGWDQTKTPDFVDRETAQKLTDNIVRKCHKCDVYFIKSNGCNKLVCRCGATQCYCCRAVDVDYNHYCNCSTSKAKDCCNKCDLFDDVKAKERKTRDELLKSAKKRFETTAPVSDMKISNIPKRHSNLRNESKKNTQKNHEEVI
ncbi:hypothetical protein FO519_005829 [Halicephalobus sp. NKZ332]|nr:hypothetical protein FO519_005829 [Halicephalobus sp. NKZ332]